MAGFKQAILLRKDLGMSTGKLVAQGSHASLGAYQNASEQERDAWTTQGQKKIVLEASEQEIQDKMSKAQAMNIPHFKVKDAGHTEIEPGTVTALGIGPAKENQVDKITSDLPLLK